MYVYVEQKVNNKKKFNIITPGQVYALVTTIALSSIRKYSYVP
jgi:hypothetical protein